VPALFPDAFWAVSLGNVICRFDQADVAHTGQARGPAPTHCGIRTGGQARGPAPTHCGVGSGGQARGPAPTIDL